MRTHGEQLSRGDRVRLSQLWISYCPVVDPRIRFRVGTVVGFSRDSTARIWWDGNRPNTTDAFAERFLEKVDGEKTSFSYEK